MKLNELIKKVRKLCTPAFLYLALSMLTIFVLLFQNLGNNNKYCMGSYQVNCKHKWSVFAFKILYVMLFTLLLQFLCERGYAKVSWFLVLFPYILMFLMLGIFMIMSLSN
tara:strand:+ start:22 stop:351 length:330 start_codon:yes stop_codon:yes gene_type:complete